MHISYEEYEDSKLIEDKDVKKMIDAQASEKDVINVSINNLNKRIEDFKNEQKIINTIAARFGSFLKQNAIMPYNDSIKVKYLNIIYMNLH